MTAQGEDARAAARARRGTIRFDHDAVVDRIASTWTLRGRARSFAVTIVRRIAFGISEIQFRFITLTASASRRLGEDGPPAT